MIHLSLIDRSPTQGDARNPCPTVLDATFSIYHPFEIDLKEVAQLIKAHVENKYPHMELDMGLRREEVKFVPL